MRIAAAIQSDSSVTSRSARRNVASRTRIVVFVESDACVLMTYPPVDILEITAPNTPPIGTDAFGGNAAWHDGFRDAVGATCMGALPHGT